MVLVISKIKFLNHLLVLLPIVLCLLCIGCSKDKVVAPSLINLEGIWLETFQSGFMGYNPDSTGNYYYVRKTLTSSLAFNENCFYLKISDSSGLVIKDDSGSYTIRFDTVFFAAPIDDSTTFNYRLNFQLVTSDSLKIWREYIQDPNGVTISEIELIWYVWDVKFCYENERQMGPKTSGTFIRQE